MYVVKKSIFYLDKAVYDNEQAIYKPDGQRSTEKKIPSIP